MQFKGKRILILEGYARQCLPFMRSFKKQGCEVTLLCNSKIDLGYASRLPDHKILGICDPDRYEESERYICRLIKEGQYDLVVPLVDFSAKILSTNKEELQKYAIIASNDSDVFIKAQDKLSVMQFCMDNDVPCPKTLRRVQSVADIKAANMAYPLVVKPRCGCGARGFHCFENETELMAFAETADLSEQVVQEYIPQSDKNLSANLFVDNDGTVKAAFVYMSRRWYPLKGGTGTFNQMVDRPDVITCCKRLVQIMGLKGWVGVDLIDDPRDGIPKVIEINPRILACAKIGFDAGIDMGKMLLEKEFGLPVAGCSNYKTDIYVRMSQTDILWFLKSPDRFKVKPSWFSMKKTKDQTFSWDDPLPWFAFLIRGLSKLKKEEEARE